MSETRQPDPPKDPPKIEPQYFSPNAAAKLLGVGKASVLAFINSGQLRASNVGRGGKPRWLISKHDLDEFLDIRSNQDEVHVIGKRWNKSVKTRSTEIMGADRIGDQINMTPQTKGGNKTRAEIMGADRA